MNYSNRLVLACFASTLCLSSVLTAQLTPPADTNFGSDNDGFGGFTGNFETDAGTNKSWTLVADAARYTNADNPSGLANASLLEQFNLNRSAGNSYSFTGVSTWVSTYADDNQRSGLMLFADDVAAVGDDEGLAMILNIDSGNFEIRAGVNGTEFQSATYNGINNASAIGSTYTYLGEIEFTNGGLDINVGFTLTDANDFSQTLNATISAAAFTGEFFGFANRTRVRGDTGRDVDFVNDYESLSVTVVPEPEAVSLLMGVCVAGLLFNRRKGSK